jgi:hypothetical protein
MNGRRIFNRLFVGTLLLAVLGAAFTYDSLAYASHPVKTSARIPQVEILAVVADPSSGLTTNEAGDLQPTFDVYLDTDPGGPVTVYLASSEPAEGTVSPAEMAFDSGNYTVHQTATVTGVDDDVDDDDQPYTIDLTSTIDGTVLPVSVTNTDDDTAGITVTTTPPVETTEAGDTAVFTIVLDSEPTHDVTIGLSSSNTDEGTVSPAAQTFTSANWSTSQDVTITGVDDFVIDGDIPYTITTAQATSDDPLYAAIDPDDVSVTNLDDDAAGITVIPTSTMETTEAGGTATFDVELDTQPAGEVTIVLSSDTPAEGVVTTTSPLSFDDTTWNVAQSVTVEGVDDAIVDGDIGYNIVLDPASTADPDYDTLLSSNAAITNLDDDASLTLEKTVILDDGGTAVEGDFQAYIDDNPVEWDIAQILTAGAHTASEDTLLGYIPSDWGGSCATDGSVTLAAGDELTCTITNDDADSTLTLFKSVIIDNGGTAVETDFQAYIGDTPVDWSVTQSLAPGTYTVSEDTLPYYNAPGWTGDCAADGTITVSEGENLTCSITNDDLAVDFNPASDSADESTPTMLVTVQLSDISDFDVTVPFSLSGTAVEGTDYTITPSPLIILAGEASGVITITIIDDNTPEADKDVILTMGTLVNAFPGTVTSHTYTILDDDIVGVTVEPTTGLLTSEDGLSDTFTVVLDTQPTLNVTIDLSSSDTTEGTVNPSSLTFTSANWDSPQEVTITGVDDLIADGDVDYSIITAPAVSNDPDYSGLNPSDVEVINSDNDTSGYSITPTSGWTTEGGVSFTVQILIRTQPTSQVTLNISSTKPDEGTVSPTQIIVTPEDWGPGTPYKIIITGVDDLEVDGDINYKVKIETTSDDPDYDGFTQVIQMVNYDAPTIEWVYPVGDNGTIVIDDLVPIRLKVRSMSNEPISKVYFYRYDPYIPYPGSWPPIGEDDDPPYQVFLDPTDLYFDFNQVFAYAEGITNTPDGNPVQSQHKRILIDRREGMVYRIYLPIIFKQTQ